MIVIGVVLLVRTFASGGEVLAIGFLLGLLFVGLGAGRLFLSTRIR
jgi:hypothetical protein